MRARRPNKTKVKRKAKNLNNISFAGVHKLVQQSWDKTKTLRQNYQKMGLVSSVGGSAGGSGMEAEEYIYAVRSLLKIPLKLLKEQNQNHKEGLSKLIDQIILKTQRERLEDD